MTNPHTAFVVGAYGVGLLLIVLEVVLVRRRLQRARTEAAKPLLDDDESQS